MRYHFQWDPEKNRANRRKHGLDFRRATGVFRDPFAVSIFDNEHSASEDRWITIGASSSGPVLVVAHTFEQEDAERAEIRVISARRATRRELRQYEKRP